jgi:outer membrane protein OmpA-like peptidoglycan-associated protein
LTSSGLGSFLQSQKNSILSAIPSGFNLAGALGLGSIGDIGSKVTSIANHAADTTKKATSVKLLWPLVILAAIAALVFFLTQRGCNNPDAVSSTHTDTSSAVIETAEKKDMDKPSGKLDEATGNYIYDLGDTVSINLPNNAGELKVGKWSTEAKLVEFLANKDAVIDTIKGNWFDFTNVRFTTGGAAITEDSYSQLKNLVMIVKAFPAAQFKIGGYTDNTGDPANNISLSQKRADAVAQEVVKLGAGQTQITSAKGYGAEHPVGDNGTAEGRAMNRRVSVNVKAK